MFKSPAVLLLPVTALSFLVGILLLQWQTHLPSLYWSFGLLAVFLVSLYCHFYKVRYRFFLLLLLFFLLGFFRAVWQGSHYLSFVPSQAITGQNVLVSGVVSDLPVKLTRSTRFKFNITEFELANYKGPVPKQIRLSWYYSKQLPKPGEKWRFMVRLKPPSGLQNPGGFDYEAWLYQQNIHATGYIRKGEHNKKLEEAGWTSIINRLRYQIKQAVDRSVEPQSAAVLNALAIGYRGDMSPELWKVFINTGTNHLIAISGLHIGLVAGFVWLLLRLLTRVRLFSHYLTYRRLLTLSFLAALFYAALAGFTIPTQRALIMLAVVYSGLFFYRQLTLVQSLSLALFVVLMISPVSVLAVGFWLSFMAVAAIGYSISGRLHGRHKVLVWIWPQLVVIIALMPLSFYFFQQSSVIALLANVVAIPLIGMLILPALLLALLLMPFFSLLASALLVLVAKVLSYLLLFLQSLAEFSLSVWVHSAADMPSLLLAMLGLILLFSPYGMPARSLSVLLLLPLLTGKASVQDNNAFELHVLDVGQGLSVLVKTQNHQLLFDAGGKYSNRFDLGDKVVVPFLRQMGINQLDTLMVSNGDNDHIGGAQMVLDSIPSRQLIGRDIENLAHDDKALCKRGQSWRWDGIDFEVLHPTHQQYSKRNNYSCVLKISDHNHSVLITADIEKKAEKALLKHQPHNLSARVMLVPHHGSKTSSSIEFLQAVDAETAIYSSGYLNRYRFPRPEIVARYDSLGIKQLNTAKSGHIALLFDQNSPKYQVLRYRQLCRRYWHRGVSKGESS